MRKILEWIALIIVCLLVSYFTHQFLDYIGFGNSRKEPEQHYKYDFAVVNKSFKRDLERSLQLYESFEKYFKEAHYTPFYIVVPKQDLVLFVEAFEKAHQDKKIRIIPNIISENYILEAANEPDVTFCGNWTQQVVKMGFGLTGIARYYMTIDSDTYFTKPFDKKILFRNGTLKTIAWKPNENALIGYKQMILSPWTGESPKGGSFIKEATGYDNLLFIKNFFGSKGKNIYVFVSGHGFWDSEALHRMKQYTITRGTNFARLIRIIPFEQQWYGEYILQHEKFIPANSLFLLIHDYSKAHPVDGGKDYYGITYQSILYNDGKKERKEIRYKKS
jgi:hypothetical protein